MNCYVPTSVTFDVRTMAPLFMSAAGAAGTAGCLSNRRWSNRGVSRQPSDPIPRHSQAALLPGRGLAAWPPAAALFVGANGDRISRGIVQYRVPRAFRRAGIDADRARDALVHGLRHTFATELANSDVSVYTLMKLLGHQSMVTAQRYVTAAGTETRAAAAQNRLYRLLTEGRET